MINHRFSSLFFLLLSISTGLFWVPSASARNRSGQTIEVVVGDCTCGNRLSTFQTFYQGREVEVDLGIGLYSTKFINGNEILKKSDDWYSIFCPKPGKDRGTLSGKTVKLSGRWQGANNFEASAVYLNPPPLSKKVTPRPVPIYTPPIGSPERHQMMNALRAKYSPDVIFIVKYLKVSGRWAWATVIPRSKNGQEEYEGQSALFQKGPDGWMLSATLDLSGDAVPIEFRKLRLRYPDVPSQIFDLEIPSAVPPGEIVPKSVLNEKLNAAVEAGDSQVVSALLAQGADPNYMLDFGGKVVSSGGYTVLMLAAHFGHLKVIKELLEKGARINLKTNDGQTALMEAASGGYAPTVALLIKAGADVNARTKDGYTALRWAQKNVGYDYLQTIRILKSNGATD